MSRRPTSIDTSVRTSIDTEPRDMVATLILVRDERGDLYDQEGHLRKATGTCPAVPEATRKLTCYSHQILEVRIVESAKKNAPHRSTTTLVHRSILVNHRRPRHYSSRPILAHHRRPKTPMSRRPTSIDTSVRTSIDTEPRDMVATLILVRDERGDLYDEEGHLRKATGLRIDAQGAAIPEYMPSSTRSNKETQLLFSPDPASLERIICKKTRSSLIDNNTCSSLDFVQPPST
ncbi:hypothetical protein F2Q70_00029809 [Brassica cretica]|uniref:Uncharacterized protein n=1 Tax=Brassica cretica TaxID=69181 RepID=A0A8S9FFQ3_BRACR|nr:hypothetical protein F2Q70_00029809 [Brassica cretica]